LRIASDRLCGVGVGVAAPLFVQPTPVIQQRRNLGVVRTERLLVDSKYNNRGRYADVEPLYTRSLAILERALGPDNPNVAAALMARLYYIDAAVTAEPGI
jgi:hypothetical protein